MKKHFDQIKNCIDGRGKVTADANTIKTSIKAAEDLAASLLGTTLSIKGKKFIIRMLEIYYGGVGDDAHDWYKKRYGSDNSSLINHTDVQNQDGFRIYIKSLNVSKNYRRNRLDIVVGHANVPISFLLRSVWDENFNLVGEKNGSPNTVLWEMDIQPEDHGQIIAWNDPTASINLEDTQKAVIAQKGLSIRRNRRLNVDSDFEEIHGLLWNFSLR